MENNLITVKQFAERFPWPSENAMRAFINDAKWGKNNLQDAFIRVGRRVLIDPKVFFEKIRQIKK